jgi:GntR family transcriptional regulator/MocR family aminotransferase
VFADVRIASGRNVQRRLYEALREAILAGRLLPGTRLPATRALAEELGVARQTVVLVYERLLSEGYAVGRVGAGTFVSGALLAAPGVQEASGAGSAPPGGEGARMGARLPRSRWSARAAAVASPAAPPRRLAFDFRTGVPDWEAFPHARWRWLLSRRWRSAAAAPDLSGYGDPAGYRPLREALAAYLARSRGLRCDADQVLIVSGSQQGLDLLARVCLDVGDTAAVEDPGYPPARAICTAAGASILPVAVDDEGLVVAALRGQAAMPRLLYVTPSHQYPTGVTLSLRRRLELLEWAAAAGTLVVEDDYDSEFRYSGRPLPALQGLDERGCVAYVGSCSSVLFPPLRIGWIVAPRRLFAPLVAAKWLADRQTATLDQQVLADFIASGDFTRHLRRSRRLYGGRRGALAAAVATHLPPACRLTGDAAGLQTLLVLPDGIAEAAVVAGAAAHEVGLEGTSACFAGSGAPRPGVLLGFAALTESAIDEGIRRLGHVLSEVRAG